MNLKRFLPVRTTGITAKAPDGNAGRLLGSPARIQREPAEISDRSGKAHRVFVDTVARRDGRAIVLGWATCPKIELRLLQDGRREPLTNTNRHVRDDVAAALGSPAGKKLGFGASTEAPVDEGSIELEICIPNGDTYRTGPLAENSALTDVDHQRFPGLMGNAADMLRAFETGSDAWWKCLAALPELGKATEGYAGFIEGCLVSPEGGGVIFGWAIHPPNAIIWLEDDAQNVFPLSHAFRRERRDISAAYSEVSWSLMNAAFVLHAPELDPDPALRLRAVTASGVVTLAEHIGSTPLPADPRQAAQNSSRLKRKSETSIAAPPLSTGRSWIRLLHAEGRNSLPCQQKFRTSGDWPLPPRCLSSCRSTSGTISWNISFWSSFGTPDFWRKAN
ncbi:hypothetical protein [Pararhodobacter sp. SW119]|uniref:hypothetical protein n=1 Tax=Pararhodobacter sp. SW119 TaxID=2780075 RepID=UPI001ADF3AA8|nr:hypothetical protein [Pararhodobacter sp. SW119]